MEMLARRTAMAERQAARRLAKRVKQEERPLRYPSRELRQETTYRLAMARVARREDWHLGPLAPRRDVGDALGQSLPRTKKPLYNEGQARITGKKPELPTWGSIDREAANLGFKPLDWQLEERWAWAGGKKYPSLVAGDRVVVLDGAWNGQIGVVQSVEEEQGTCKIEGIGMVNVTVPEFLRTKTGGASTSQFQSSIPVSAVRLVHPVNDPLTGETRDVIIKQLVAVDYMYDRPTGRREWNRLVPGLNLLIPWPDRGPENHEDQACDTLRIEVEKKTFVPTLSIPPMPAQVIDELRNRFSKFRTRHTEEYIAEKQAEIDAKKKRAGMADLMLTPVQEYNKMQREIRAAAPPPVLTNDMLAKIGEVMARNRSKAQANVEQFQAISAPLPADLPPAESQPPPS